MRLERGARLGATAAAAVVALGLALGACSSGDNKKVTSNSGASASASPEASDSASAAPEDLRAPDAQVAAGLKQIQDISAEAAKAVGSDQAKAQQLSDEIEPVWSTIEGTVKANDVESYLTFEDSFAALKNAAESGDTSKAQDASTAIAATVATYLAKYPG
jgi:hypothetical protein